MTHLQIKNVFGCLLLVATASMFASKIFALDDIPGYSPRETKGAEQPGNELKKLIIYNTTPGVMYVRVFRPGDMSALTQDRVFSQETFRTGYKVNQSWRVQLAGGSLDFGPIYRVGEISESKADSYSITWNSKLRGW